MLYSINASCPCIRCPRNGALKPDMAATQAPCVTITCRPSLNTCSVSQFKAVFRNGLLVIVRYINFPPDIITFARRYTVKMSNVSIVSHWMQRVFDLLYQTDSVNGLKLILPVYYCNRPNALFARLVGCIYAQQSIPVRPLVCRYVAMGVIA